MLQQQCVGGHWPEGMLVSIVGVPMLLGIRSALVRERLVEVARVRVEQKVSYAEAVKSVEDDGSRVSSRPWPIQ
jgi:hypothetical protein